MAQYSSSRFEFSEVTDMISGYIERRRGKADPKPTALKPAEPPAAEDVVLNRMDLHVLVKHLQGYFLTKAEQARVAGLIEELSVGEFKSITLRR